MFDLEKNCGTIIKKAAVVVFCFNMLGANKFSAWLVEYLDYFFGFDYPGWWRFLAWLLYLVMACVNYLLLYGFGSIVDNLIVLRNKTEGKNVTQDADQLPEL